MRRQSTRVVCPRGHTFVADVYRSANVTKAPELRAQILERRFNRIVCPACRAESYADVPFLYHDMELALRVWVYPARYRAGVADQRVHAPLEPVDRHQPAGVEGEEVVALVPGPLASLDLDRVLAAELRAGEHAGQRFERERQAEALVWRLGRAQRDGQ